jgi:SAM-dependent methyltransferase
MPQATLGEIRAVFDVLRGDPSLRAADNFQGRSRAIDVLEVEVIDRIDGLLPHSGSRIEWARLRGQAEELKGLLEELDQTLFRTLRSEIRAAADRARTLADILDRHRGAPAGETAEAFGYDSLDALMNGILHPGALPSETLAREPGMIFFQKTPVRIVLEMVGKARLSRDDMFYDLGSGLGQVPILVHLLTGAKAVGIEVEPAYCDYARECAAGLDLTRAEFRQADARKAELPDGAVYFMYTPFEGAMLEAVLEKLRKSARTGIRLFTYGPCTSAVSRQAWLNPVGPVVNGAHRLGEFRSGRVG